MGTGNNGNPGVNTDIGPGNGLGHGLQEGCQHDGAQGDNYGDCTIKAHCTEGRPTPFAQLYNIRAGRFTGNSGIILAAHHPGHAHQKDVSNEHQGGSQGCGITNTGIVTHVDIGYDTRGHNLDITGHTNDGGDTEAGACSDKNQKATG